MQANGVLGTPTATAAPSWSSVARGDDPWYLDAVDLAPVQGGPFDLFWGAGLQGGVLGNNGVGGLSVSLETTAGSTTLINISLSKSGVTVGSVPSNVQLFQMTSPDSDLSGIIRPLTAASISSMLSADLADGSLDTPLYLGIRADGLDFPSTAFSDGSLMRVHVDSSVDDSAQGSLVPEPRTSALACLGLLLGLRKLRKLEVQKLNRK